MKVNHNHKSVSRVRRDLIEQYSNPGGTVKKLVSEKLICDAKMRLDLESNFQKSYFEIIRPIMGVEKHLKCCGFIIIIITSSW